MTWGTYGINGDEPLVIKPIEDLTTTHIINIIKTQSISDSMRIAFCNILLKRTERNKKFITNKWKYKNENNNNNI